MDNQKTKGTVPVLPVGAGGEQSISKESTQSIAERSVENKPQEESFEELMRALNQTSDPNFLSTVSLNDLFDNVYQSRLPIIDGLLYPGTYLFAGSPKVGKSFLMTQLAYHISMGLPPVGFPCPPRYGSLSGA